MEDDDKEDLSSQSEEEDNGVSGSTKDTQTSYLPKARDPLYCKAEHSCLWELVMVSNGFLIVSNMINSHFVVPVNPTLSSISASVC